ncbi:MAG TPA: rhomboid family intramembrane serine protease, partial [Aquaticitalea sp.]|nr:rhomboid family intramembrane serine protease [Aquaticitalea sp.]
LKTVHRKASGNVAGHNKKEFLEFNKQKQVDLILDKISKSGYDSLSKEEKEFLFKAGKE